jgi:hypothetical protein
MSGRSPREARGGRLAGRDPDRGGSPSRWRSARPDGAGGVFGWPAASDRRSERATAAQARRWQSWRAERIESFPPAFVSLVPHPCLGGQTAYASASARLGGVVPSAHAGPPDAPASAARGPSPWLLRSETGILEAAGLPPWLRCSLTAAALSGQAARQHVLPRGQSSLVIDRSFMVSSATNTMPLSVRMPSALTCVVGLVSAPWLAPAH